MKMYDDYNTVLDIDTDIDTDIDCKCDLDLEPCPWCKEKPELIDSETYGYSFYCGDASNGDHYIETGWCKTVEEAAALWNKCRGKK